MYIHQRKDWPNFKWDSKLIESQIGDARNLQGRFVGKMESLGFDLRNEASLTTLTNEIVKSHEIEGKFLNNQEVRSSIAVRLGIETVGIVQPSRSIDGIVEMMLDATQKYAEVLTEDRLFGWHNCLFPTGRSGMLKILVGQWRDDSTGPMQVISGPMGKESVHFQAPDTKIIAKEMTIFLDWVNNETKLDAVIKAAIAHFGFITIHPFEDGNGRIARAITELLLCRSDKLAQRFYSMSSQIQKERKGYYQILESCQKNGLDITEWLNWFLKTLVDSIQLSEQTLDIVLKKHKFWNHFTQIDFNERQRKVLNKLFDDFKSKLTSSKWARINKCSRDTALRDIQDLEAKGILKKMEGGGRSTGYELKELDK